MSRTESRTRNHRRERPGSASVRCRRGIVTTEPIDRLGEGGGG